MHRDQVIDIRIDWGDGGCYYQATSAPSVGDTITYRDMTVNPESVIIAIVKELNWYIVNSSSTGTYISSVYVVCEAV